MASGLHDDLILEIIARLPLKYAVQYSVLNKNILRSISHQPNFLPHYSTTFHCSNYDPKIFASIWQAIRSTALHPLRRSVTLDMSLVIKASCNGLLLLCFRNLENSYYIFNPTTAAIMAVGRQIELYDSVGLAVPENSHSRFKLVALDVLSPTRLQFTVLAPSAAGSADPMLVKSRVDLECGHKFKLLTDDNNRPVYAHGSLFWLAYVCRLTMEFHVETEQVGFIRGPVELTEKYLVSKWFGFADGALHFVFASRSEIMICRYDHFNGGGWRVRHRMPNLCNPKIDNYVNGKPLIFDGRWLLFFIHKSVEGGDLHRYDLVRDLWEKFGSLGCNQIFFSYNSSFAEVSDTYLSASLWEHEDRRNVFLQLQKLLRPADTPIHSCTTRRTEQVKNKKNHKEFVKVF